MLRHGRPVQHGLNLVSSHFVPLQSAESAPDIRPAVDMKHYCTLHIVSSVLRISICIIRALEHPRAHIWRMEYSHCTFYKKNSAELLFIQQSRGGSRRSDVQGCPQIPYICASGVTLDTLQHVVRTISPHYSHFAMFILFVTDLTCLQYVLECLHRCLCCPSG